jgi:proteic killer suppression protein
MEIRFAHKDVERLCNDSRHALKRLGQRCADKLQRRMDDLRHAANLEQMRLLPGRCHELKHDLRGRLALDLEGGWRLVFAPDHDPTPTKPDGGLDWLGVTIICVERVEDYHG